MLSMKKSSKSSSKLTRKKGPGIKAPNGFIQIKHHNISQRIVLDAINDGIVIFDTHNKVSTVNNKFEVLFGTSQYNVEGMTEKEFLKLLNEAIVDQNGEVDEFLAGIASKDSLIGGTVNIKFKEPKDRYLSMYTSPMFDEDMSYLGRIWKFEDKTKEEQINKMKSEFISIASHQLRTPLTSIKGFLAMIFDGDFGEIPEEFEEPLGAVKKSAERMIDLVNGLLDVSRLEMGKIVPELAKIDLVKLIEQIIDNHDELADKKSQKIIFEKDIKDSITSTDKKLITECLKNYISNAIKYSPNNSEIIVNLKQNENKYKIDVKDSGVGIPEEAKEKLFAKFYRADNVMTENFEGTGLGLYYVKKAIESLKGEVGFESKLGKGSTFWFIIPKI